MTEIIIQVKESNKYIVVVQGEALEAIKTKFRNRLRRENNYIARFEMNAYTFNSFVSWLKHQNFQYNYKEIF